ncbi:MAG: DUF4912 domain-containing protein [Verrucomicrobiota bacterium]
MGKTKTGKVATGGTAKAKKPSAFKVSKKTVVQSKTEEDVHKYEVTREPAPVPAFEELGRLPESYGEEILYLIARDPHWLFTYWDIDWSKYSKSKMLKGEHRIFLKICTEEGIEESRIEINPEAKNWYVPVSKPAALYFAELGWLDKKGVWKTIVRSLPAATPAATLAPESKASFATIPFHLTFQRIMEMVKGSMRAGENLTQALSRLQSEGRAAVVQSGKVEDLTEEQKNILATLFGSEILEKLRMGSGEIERLLRKHLQEKLHSESASGIKPKGAIAPGISSLSSGLKGWGPEISSLFSSIGGWGPAEVTSLFSGINLWGPGVSSLSSGAGQWGPEVTSLFSGVGASWSAQPFGAKRERGFFMHVNAEVIFYGGTDPDAKVWIDGKEIQLSPDGSFRYHFRFPDGDFQIPIVAQSPDKVEERSATLSFKRATSRKGDVGHTAQPKVLKKPIGKRK